MDSLVGNVSAIGKGSDVQFKDRRMKLETLLSSALNPSSRKAFFPIFALHNIPQGRIEDLQEVSNVNLISVNLRSEFHMRLFQEALEKGKKVRVAGLQ